MIFTMIGLMLGLGVVTVEQIPGQAPLSCIGIHGDAGFGCSANNSSCPPKTGCIEIHGVAASDFKQEIWQAGTLNLVHDLRHPLLKPRQAGTYRNIYAPSAVRVKEGWRLFYGAWDGVTTGNDRIYSLFTRDFVDFGARETVIEHGVFIHACNVNALACQPDGFEMVCTVYPDKQDRNKPAYFSSPDGVTWNGQKAPYPADYKDIISIEGYPDYADADINGMNVIFRDGDTLRLYFNNFKQFGKVYRASGSDGKNFTYTGVALECGLVVNDVKRFDVGKEQCWLMGLHMNREGLWYALSSDGDSFEAEMPLLTHAGSEDRYIVALGWVVEENRLLGVLYGAGAVPELNRNRIFARWLQKKVVFTSEDGTRCEPMGATGPDRQLISIPEGVVPTGTLQVFAEDG
ncbi:MAG: hypothetical protein KAH38_05740, partial [Candidatus Hydrogenedentes bacterium]|nr:hypothetical protein [Candidatus Hydrogenedentota bacterium]